MCMISVTPAGPAFGWFTVLDVFGGPWTGKHEEKRE